MELKGQVHKFGDDVNTDEIHSGRYLTPPTNGAGQARRWRDADPEFCQPDAAGISIVAGKNFGCGSFPEHAPIALKADRRRRGDRRELRPDLLPQRLNMGPGHFRVPEATAAIKGGQKISVDMDTGVITDLTTGKQYASQAIPPFMQELLSDGGLMAFVKKHLEAKSA